MVVALPRPPRPLPPRPLPRPPLDIAATSGTGYPKAGRVSSKDWTEGPELTAATWSEGAEIADTFDEAFDDQTLSALSKIVEYVVALKSMSAI